MKYSFFQHQLTFYYYINFVWLAPLMAIFIQTFHPNMDGEITLRFFLQFTLTGYALFIIGIIVSGIANKILVDEKGINLCFLKHVKTSISWDELTIVYKKKDNLGSTTIFENSDGSKQIPITLLSQRNAGRIYDFCTNTSIKVMIEDLKLIKKT